MEDVKPHISVDLIKDTRVSLLRHESVTDLLWGEVIDWWHDGNSDIHSSSDRLEISLEFFYMYRSWLRTNWASSGYKVSFTPELKTAIQSLDNERNIFDSLVTDTSIAPKYDLQPLRLRRLLTVFQSDNVDRLLRMRSGANFSVPGAGKTTTTLVVWVALRRQGLVDRLLVIAPKSAFEAWHNDAIDTFYDVPKSVEFSDRSIPIDTEILIVNYEQLENLGKLLRIKLWAKKHNCMIVVDEAHRVKGGAHSVRWRAVRQITLTASRVDLLTGTPMPQGYEDLKHLFNISWPRIPENFFSEGKLCGMKRGGVFVRTTKEELGLPKVTIKEVQIPMGDIQTQVYSALRMAYSGSLMLNSDDAIFLGRKGRAVLTLLAVATNPGLLSGMRTENSFLGLKWPPREISKNHTLLDIISNYVRHEIPTKYDWVRRYVQRAADENRKVLVWSNFIGNLLALENMLKPHSPALVYGAVNNETRKDEINRFRNDATCSVLLTNPQTLGEGISLHHECHEAIYVDRTYNAALYLQSLDRIHRLGLSADQVTKIFILSSKGTIDFRVGQRLNAKIERLSDVMNDSGLVRASVPSDLDSQTLMELVGLDKLDMSDLYSHLATDE
jgi:hypothetical protein